MASQNQYFPQSVPHPGETLKEKLEEMGMGPKEFAVRTAKPEKTVSAILKGTSSITPDMAFLFENVTRIPTGFWLDAQNNFDGYRAKLKRAELLKESVEWSRNFPIAAMVRMGWLEKATQVQIKTAHLLSFFGFASHDSWNQYYYDQKLKTAFRISLKSTKEPFAISAWLRRGELQASELQANIYSARKFQDSLPRIKRIMADHPVDFFSRLQDVCAEAGVKVVHTPCLPKAPLNGSTRWINNTPIIQLSGRHKRNDIFWFTFFHEAGHILLHGKKDVFLEDVEYSDKDLKKEKEADEFARIWTLTDEQEIEILENPTLTLDLIRSYATRFGTHPGIIIGRLHHKKIIHPSVGRNLIARIEIVHFGS